MSQITPREIIELVLEMFGTTKTALAEPFFSNGHRYPFGTVGYQARACILRLATRHTMASVAEIYRAMGMKPQPAYKARLVLETFSTFLETRPDIERLVAQVEDRMRHSPSDPEAICFRRPDESIQPPRKSKRTAQEELLLSRT